MTTQVKMPSPRVYFSVDKILRFIALFVFKQDVTGMENVPRQGPFLFVLNHLSIFDVPFTLFISPRQMVMFCADKWRTVPGAGQLADLMGVIWVVRGEPDMDAVKLSLNHLKAGGVLALAPEGTRSRGGGLLEGKTGAAFLADRTSVPIVPVGMWGTDKVAGNLKRLRRSVVHAAIGKPFCLPPNGRAKGETLKEYTDIIMCHIAALLPPEYRGLYADHPKLHELLAAEA